MAVRAVSDRGVHTMTTKKTPAKRSATREIKQLSNHHLDKGTIVCKAQRLKFDPEEGTPHATSVRKFVKDQGISPQDFCRSVLGYFLASDKRVYTYIQFKTEKRVFPAKLAPLAWKPSHGDLDEWRTKIRTKCEGDSLSWKRLQALGLTISVKRGSEKIKIPVSDARYLRNTCLPKPPKQPRKKTPVYAAIKNEALKAFSSTWEVAKEKNGPLFDACVRLMPDFDAKKWTSCKWLELAGNTPERLDRHWQPLSTLTAALSKHLPAIIVPTTTKKPEPTKTHKKKRKKKKSPKTAKPSSKKKRKSSAAPKKQPKKKPAKMADSSVKKKPAKMADSSVKKKPAAPKRKRQDKTDTNPASKKKKKSSSPPPDGKELSKRFRLDKDGSSFQALEELCRVIRREGQWKTAMKTYALKGMDIGKLATADSRRAWGRLMQVLKQRDPDNYKILGELCLCFPHILFKERAAATKKSIQKKKKSNGPDLFSCLSEASSEDEDEDEVEEEEEEDTVTWHEDYPRVVVLMGMYDMWKSTATNYVDGILAEWSGLSEIEDAVQLFKLETLEAKKQTNAVRCFLLGLFDHCFPPSDEEEMEVDELTALVRAEF